MEADAGPVSLRQGLPSKAQVKDPGLVKLTSALNPTRSRMQKRWSTLNRNPDNPRTLNP